MNGIILSKSYIGIHLTPFHSIVNKCNAQRSRVDIEWHLPALHDHFQYCSLFEIGFPRSEILLFPSNPSESASFETVAPHHIHSLFIFELDETDVEFISFEIIDLEDEFVLLAWNNRSGRLSDNDWVRLIICNKFISFNYISEWSRIPIPILIKGWLPIMPSFFCSPEIWISRIMWAELAICQNINFVYSRNQRRFEPFWNISSLLFVNERGNS